MNEHDADKGLSAAPAKDDGEHRNTHRKRTLKQARAVLSDWTAMDCKLRDMSDSGARLVFGNLVSLPQEFRLHNVSDGTITPVRLRWQRGLEAGVTFDGPAEPIHTLKP